MKYTHQEKQLKRKELRLKGLSPLEVEVEMKKLTNPNYMEEEKRTKLLLKLLQKL